MYRLLFKDKIVGYKEKTDIEAGIKPTAGSIAKSL